ncbi:MAG: M23 family metallopeptidase [Bacteroidota bacterium]
MTAVFKNSYLFSVLLTTQLIKQTATAQPQNLEITYEQTDQGYDFYCQNPNESPYLVKINFSILKNLRPNFSLKKEITVTSGRQRIFSLKKERDNQSTNFNYSWSYRKGSLPVKIDPDFAYLLPLQPNKITRPLDVKYVGEVIGQPEGKPKDWYCVGLTMGKVDTIVAARSGYVIEVEDQIHFPKDHLLMTKKMNYVEILHQDGTIGKYQLFQKEGVLVRAGEQVIAGQVLGIVESEHFEHGPHLRFSVYYALPGEGYGYVPLKFHAAGINQQPTYQKQYKVEHPPALIEQELSKRQKKKLKKRKS